MAVNNKKVIALPFAGGNKYSFASFSDKVPGFSPLEYPGRGLRINESPLDQVDLIVQDVLRNIISLVKPNDEYIIYGHSMGALIGYLVCHEINKLKFTKPVKLVVSGRNSPCCTNTRENISELRSDIFWKKIESYGGVSKDLMDNVEIRDFYEPILRADFRLIEKYKFDPKSVPLSIPIDVFYGVDEDIDDLEILKWRDKTTSDVNFKKMAGNHFFIYGNQEYLVKYFNETSFLTEKQY